MEYPFDNDDTEPVSLDDLFDSKEDHHPLNTASDDAEHTSSNGKGEEPKPEDHSIDNTLVMLSNQNMSETHQTTTSNDETQNNSPHDEHVELSTLIEDAFVMGPETPAAQMNDQMKDTKEHSDSVPSGDVSSASGNHNDDNDDTLHMVWLVALIAIFVVILGGGAYYYWNHTSSKNNIRTGNYNNTMSSHRGWDRLSAANVPTLTNARCYARCKLPQGMDQ